MPKAKASKVPEEFNDRWYPYMASIKPKYKLNTNDVDEMKRRWKNFLMQTHKFGMELTNSAFYTAMGLGESTIKSYVNERYNDNPERGDAIAEMLNYLRAYREQTIMKGYTPAVPGIFAQKNFDGMRDVQEVVTHTDRVQTRDVKEIAARYMDVVDVEFERRKQIETKKTLNASSEAR